MNYNDVNLCLRVRAAGLEVLFEPAALLQHRECQSRRPGTRHRERQRLFVRWGKLLRTGDPYYNPNLTAAREDASLALDESLGPSRFPEGR
jgi:GT2 family glycosyltransferase